jgi:uncharacterized repeat protein (TIGR04138 family)
MPILDSNHPLAKLLKTDQRYKFDAYLFVFESLNYAHEKLGMGEERPTEEEPAETPSRAAKRKTQRHLSGQQLCEAVRQYAIDQYGMMAKAVLNNWGVRTTGDIGNIVFNLIEIEQMRKTKNDRREDFENVFDFETAFVRDFKITPPEETKAE